METIKVTCDMVGNKKTVEHQLSKCENCINYGVEFTEDDSYDTCLVSECEYEPKDEPQTDERLKRLQACIDCEHTDMCEWCHTRWSKTEPQTEYRIGYYTPTNAEILEGLEDEPQTEVWITAEEYAKCQALADKQRREMPKLQLFDDDENYIKPQTERSSE